MGLNQQDQPACPGRCLGSGHRRRQRTDNTTSCKAPFTLSESDFYYHPQTKLAKVMFSQVFFCPQEWGSLSRGYLSGGSVQGRGSLSRGYLSGGFVQGRGSLSRGYLSGGLSRGGGICPGKGVSVQGVSVWGSVQGRGYLSRGGGYCPGGSLSRRPPVRLRAGGMHPTGMHSCLIFVAVRYE